MDPIHPVLQHGGYREVDRSNSRIWAYTRSLGVERLLIVLNLSGDMVNYLLPDRVRAGSLIRTNRWSAEENTQNLTLTPWEVRVYRQADTCVYS